MTSKAKQIAALHNAGFAYAEIAEHLGCRVEYVRAACSRHRHGGMTPGDRARQQRVQADPVRREAYLAGMRERARKWRAENLELSRERNRNWWRQRWATDPEFRERSREYKRKYRAARKAQSSPRNNDAPARQSQGV